MALHQHECVSLLKPNGVWCVWSRYVYGSKAVTHPRLASSICLSVAGLFIQPVFDHSQAVEALLSPAAREEAKTLERLPAVQVPQVRKPPLDRSGQAELGKASFYAAKYDHR